MSYTEARGYEARLQEARTLIEQYQSERRRKMRDEYRGENSAQGVRVLFHSIRENPVRSVLYLAVAVLFLYFSTVPFFNFTEWL
jgi:hypothetical protein